MKQLESRLTAISGIVTDIDGTLTGSDRKLDFRAAEALRKVHSDGYTVILATGNVLPIAYAFLKMIGLDGPIIAENGGILYHNQKVEYLNSVKEPQRAYDFLRKQMKVDRLFTDRWRVTEIALEPNADPDRIRHLLKSFDVNVEFSGFAIHIQERNHSKFSALRKVTARMGIEPKGLAAFGDGENDIEMLQGCGYGIAVGNAPAGVKGIASYVTENGNGAGFVDGLRWLGFDV